jgi:cellulose synthase/poly-beta-1,6-N-acetylglucosamine synthase-like glycosyltransferase
MRAAGEVILWIVGLPLLLAVLYRWLLAAASLLPSPPPPPRGPKETRFLLLVPAHDEEATVPALLEAVGGLHYPAGLVRTVVVADNCSDATAPAARAAGAEALERDDPDRPGKGHALGWALERLDLSETDAVAVLDADTVPDPDFLARAEARLAAGAEAVQAHHAVRNPGASWLTRIARIHTVMRRDLMDGGRARLGLSCPLLGNGMAFRSELLAGGWDAYGLTENWEFGARLAARGHRVTFAPETAVRSLSPLTLSAATPQRRRWMQGRFAAARREGLRLLGQGIARLDPVRLDLAADLWLPSLAVSGAWGLLYLVLAALLPCLHRPWHLAAAACLLGAQVLYYALAVAWARPGWRDLAALAMAPLFLLWKAGVGVTAALRPDRAWRRTSREG